MCHCAGLLWGWIVAGVAFIPYALWVLATANFVRAVGMGLLALAGTLGPLVLVDRFFYDKWTVRGVGVGSRELWRRGPGKRDIGRRRGSLSGEKG